MYWLILLAYLLGGIPYSWLWVYYFAPLKDGTRVDLRERGSGNVGASNGVREFMERYGKKGLAMYPVLIFCDGAKGYLAVWLAQYANCPLPFQYAIGFTAIFGHCFPIYLGFKRGKGLSTSFGILIALGFPVELAVAGALFIVVLLVTRWVSAGSLVAVASTIPVSLWQHEPRSVLILFVVLTILVWIRHHDNIVRLINKEERRLW